MLFPFTFSQLGLYETLWSWLTQIQKENYFYSQQQQMAEVFRGQKISWHSMAIYEDTYWEDELSIAGMKSWLQQNYVLNREKWIGCQIIEAMVQFQSWG